jgi:hypothetical protein
MVERGRVHAARELAQLLERLRELAARAVTSCSAAAGRGGCRLDQPQLQRERDQPLLGAVVQVALEPARSRRRRRAAGAMRAAREPLLRSAWMLVLERDDVAARTASISSGSSSSIAS